MSTAAVFSEMAKRKAKTATTRIDEELIRMANVVAAIRNISAPDYLNDILRPLIQRDYDAELASEAKKRESKRAES